MDSYRDAVLKARREWLYAVMREHEYRVKPAAEAFGMTRQHFYSLLDKFAPDCPTKKLEMSARRKPPGPKVGVAKGGNAAWRALDNAME